MSCPFCHGWVDISIMKKNYECLDCKKIFTLEKTKEPSFDVDLGYYTNVRYILKEIETGEI